MRKITLHDYTSVTADFQDDPFTRMRWSLMEFENISRKCFRHTELKVYMKDKPGNYGFLFRVLADSQDRYASKIISYVASPINIYEKREIFTNSPWKLWKMCNRVGETMLGTDYLFCN